MSTIEKQRGSHHKNTTYALALLSSRNSRATMIQVERTPFNDRALNRDLMQLCESANKDTPRLSDGRQLSFTICSICCILPAQNASVARLGEGGLISGSETCTVAQVRRKSLRGW